MSTTAMPQGKTSDTAIFGRLLSESKGRMSRQLARYVLTLGFTSDDQARMVELVARNQEGTLSTDEKQELLSYVKAGHLLALLHSKARQSLKKKLS